MMSELMANGAPPPLRAPLSSHSSHRVCLEAGVSVWKHKDTKPGFYDGGAGGRERERESDGALITLGLTERGRHELSTKR